MSGVVALAVLAAVAAPALGADAADETFYWGGPSQAIATVVIFVLLLVVLGRWAWRPIISQLQLREKHIADALNNSQKREAEAQDLLAHYRSRLDRAEADAADVVARGRQEATRIRDEFIETARLEAQQSIAQAREDISQAKQAALRELYETTAQLAVDVAGQIVSKTLSEDEHRRLLDESLTQVSEQLARKP